MKVAILTSTRFHVLDLARELDRLGHEVAFYSLVPPWRTRRLGLPARCNRWLAPLLAPLFGAQRALAQTPLAGSARRVLDDALDRLAARLVTRCDVFIGMSGMSLHTLAAVKRRHGALTFVERGSLHILAQKAVLDRRPGRARSEVSDWIVRRELAEYARADFISVPSSHVVASFRAHHVPAERLLVNPYGVALASFSATPAPPREPPRLVMAGTWSWRKGADVLARAFAEVRRALPTAELHHVGPVADVPLPEALPGFVHHAAVPEATLREHYARAHVAVLASREDGFGLVLSQALACGVPLVASSATAAADLRGLIARPEAVTTVPPDDAAALARALIAALEQRQEAGGARDLLGERGRQALSWEAYGRRWHAALGRLR